MFPRAQRFKNAVKVSGCWDLAENNSNPCPHGAQELKHIQLKRRTRADDVITASRHHLLLHTRLGEGGQGAKGDQVGTGRKWPQLGSFDTAA